MHQLSLKLLIAVFLGGGLGSVLRYLIAKIFTPFVMDGVFFGSKFSQYIQSFPVSTFAANIIGCFIIGLCFSIFALNSNYSQGVKLFLTVGFCGGLTTFSTFSMEFVQLSQQNLLLALLYLFLSCFVGFLAAFAGVYFGGVFARFL